MNENEVLEKMHSLHLMLADELKRICEKYNIKYFMIAGTMLGAIRHGGIIPWDDDMDFGILRRDFEKFLKVCDQEIDNNIFYLLTERKEKYYAFNIAKLMLQGTTFKEDLLNLGNVHEGIYIDIFPIDVVSDNKAKKWFQFKVFHTARSLLKLKTGFVAKGLRLGLRYNIGKYVAKIFPINLLKRVKHNAIARYSGMASKYVVTSDGAYGMAKETLLRQWVEELKDYPFEDRVYPGIADYEAYLSYFYGNYMKLPPEDQRDHHHRILVDFGIYDNFDSAK